MLMASLTLNHTQSDLHMAQSLNPQLSTTSKSKQVRRKEDRKRHVLLPKNKPTKGGGKEGRGSKGRVTLEEKSVINNYAQRLKLSTTTHFQSFFSHCGQF
jgi:hypothetical protein